jgi:hypothetical protein
MFARGTDNALWYRTLTGDWKPLGGGLTSGPAATTFGKELYIFVRGTDKAIWYRTLTKTWASAGGLCTSAPAVSTAGTKLELFVRGGDKHLYQREYDPATSKWTDWKGLGGIIN